MLLRLDAGIGQVVDSDLESRLFADGLHHFRELQDGELLRELVEDAEFTLLGGVVTRDLNATHGVANIQKAAGLPTLAVNRQRIIQRGLRAEAIENRPEDFVVVEAIDESLV